MPTPTIYVKITLACLLLLSSFSGGFYVEHLRFEAYREKVIAEGKVQEQHNKDILVQQQLITKQVTDDYQNKLDRIKSYYAGLHNTSSSAVRTSVATAASSTTDGTPSDPQFVEKCTITTLQLESLQDYERSRKELK
jgi:uncharacterized protein with von Willebrand factor type A (vWA) domain